MGGIYYSGDDMPVHFFRKIAVFFTAALIMLPSAILCGADNAVSADDSDEDKAEYAECYVLMEANTGTILRSRDKDKRVRMGSMNKLMTVLLAAEAIDRGELSYEDELTCSEYANSMQGAQIWLMVGERMTADELLRAVCIGNANDAACVIAEKLGGSEEEFTEMMNVRARELGMNDTLFLNPNGYYRDDEQFTTASDAAKLLAALSQSPQLSEGGRLREYFTTRLDELKEGDVQLVTSNPMAVKYDGAVGFKCGTGPQSGYFACEGAERGDMLLTAAVLDCADEDRAMGLAKELLDAGFGAYEMASPDIPGDMVEFEQVKMGRVSQITIQAESVGRIVVPKGRSGDIITEVILPSYVYAPVKKGDKIGELRVRLDDRTLKVCPVYAAEDAEEKKFGNVLFEFIKLLVSF